MARNPEQLSRRNFLRAALRSGGIAAAGLAIAEDFDQRLGYAYETAFMRSTPQAEVLRGRQSNRAILVAGGLNNDGIAIGRAMSHALLPLGSIVSVRYAETNLDPAPLHNVIGAALQQSRIRADRLDAYFNSEAGVIMGEPLRRLAAAHRIGTVVLDDAPASVDDIHGLEGMLARWHGDVLSHSRIVNWITQAVANRQMPPATDKEAATPLALSEAHRSAIVHTDSITTGMEAAFLRDNPVLPGSWAGLAEQFVYTRGQVDPLVDIASSLRGWRMACGGPDSVREWIDPYRPAVSHAAGPTYPRGVAEVLSQYPA